MDVEHRRLTLRERVQICKCVAGLRLPCGCVAGRYLTYAGDQVTIIDHVAGRCADTAHRVDMVVAETRAGAVR